ncbi:MAG TPA: fibronectin type III domain-containing protein, partial [Saprospiraceae bacterium]
MRYKNLYAIFVAFMLLLVGNSCEDKIDPVIEELNLARVFTPAGFEAKIVNMTTIELKWDVRDEADHYVVEFSEDSLEFSTIIRTVTVDPSQLPIQETFFGDTRYSARVKAVSATGSGDSKWDALTIRTAPENILLPIVIPDDIGVFGATLKWPAGELATRFVINPGNIQRTITTGEVASGEAVITGLNPYTNYTILMYAGNSQRGNAEFKTLVDPNCATCVKVSAGQDVSDAIAAAAAGSTIVIAPGTYPDEGTIVVNKDLTVQAEFYYTQPTVYAGFSCATTVSSFAVKDVVF